MKNNKLVLSLIAVLSVALIWLAVFWNPVPESAHALLDANINQAPSGGEFSIRTADGPVSLSDFQGKVVALYFGYTLCPDICPTSLGFTAAALRQLSDEERANIKTIFISVDPDRDGLEHLRDYAQYFHPDMIGGTESKEVIDKIAKQYGASYRMVETETSLGYLVDHSSTIYLIDKHGALSQSISHGTTPGRYCSSSAQGTAEVVKQI